MTIKNTTDANNALQQKVLGALEDSIEHLDANTLSRLNQARHHALAQADRPRLFTSHWLKAATFAALLVTVINGWLFLTDENTNHIDTDAFELIVVNDDYELLQDLDFVAWMIEEEHAS